MMNTMPICAGGRAARGVVVLMLVCSAQMILSRVESQEPVRLTASSVRTNIPDPGVSKAAALDLVRAIERAYRGIQTCEIRQEERIRDPDTGSEEPRGWRTHLLFDRLRASFREETWIGESSTPTVVTVCNGRQAWHYDFRPRYSPFVGKDGKEDRTDLNPKNQVMEVPVSRPIDFYSLFAQQLDFGSSWSPTIELLLGQDLIEHLQWGFSEPGPLQCQRLEPKPGDPLKLIGLRISGWEKVGMWGSLVFWVDPERFWIMRTEVENESGAVVCINKTTVDVTDRAFEKNAFDFDTTGLTAVHSAWELRAPQGFTPPASMIGKAAPAIRLRTLSGADYDLAKDPSAVVVLIFAKWNRVQLRLQPWMPKLHKWIRNTGKSVSLYAISSGQSEEAVRRLWEEQGLSIPVLLDKDEAVKEAFKVGMPQTFIIHRGKIIREGGSDYRHVVAYVEAALSTEETKRGPQAKAEAVPDQIVKRIGVEAKSSEPTSMVGKTAPEIRLKTLEGHDYDLAKDASAVVILDFWITWCGPCLQALPSLQKFHEWTQKNGKAVSLYAVNCGQTDEVVRKLWKQKQLSMNVLMDKTGTVGDAYNVVVLPKTFIIRQGKIVQEDVATDLDTLVATVERLLPRKDSE